MQDDLQFYPTPQALAERAWAKFEDKNFIRVLEPSAGTGDLLAPKRMTDRYGRRLYGQVDVIELDIRHHPRLREMGANVVGFDFLNHTNCAIYSHIIMNPPFAQGARHVLHAWQTLYEGEIVAILNAETLRNPFSTERQRLAKLIAEHGSVEFIADAFKGESVEREAEVEVALVHLKKRGDGADILGDMLENLRREQDKADELEFRMPHELALPTDFVRQTVLNFEVAVRAAKEEAIAATRAAHFAARLGQTMEMLQTKEQDANARELVPSPQAVRERFAKAHAELKNAAWTQVLRSTEVLKHLSSKAQRRVESQFETIKTLEFSAANVYGFLEGLVGQAGQIQTDMLLDVFDAIVQHHSENTVYYMGWKSNDKHRTAGMRIKRTRFILPGESCESWRSSVSFELRQMLADFDKVFAMLDGKRQPAFGLVDLFTSTADFERLKAGERLASDYFEVRYYKGIGTIHFFPRRMDVIERLNRFVGQHRQWLPPDMDQAPKDFVTQYEKAEKFSAGIVSRYKELARHSRDWRVRERNALTSSFDAKASEQAQAFMAQAVAEELESRGINPYPALEGTAQKLLSAA